MQKTITFLPARIEQNGPQKLRRDAGMFLALPIIVLVIIGGIHIVFWRTSPLIRFIDMLWVLGFWMAGTTAMFAFIILARLRISRRIQILLFAFLSISLAIYFTTLYRFTILFPSQTGLIQPAVAGGVNIIASWLLVLRFRNRIA